MYSYFYLEGVSSHHWSNIMINYYENFLYQEFFFIGVQLIELLENEVITLKSSQPLQFYPTPMGFIMLKKYTHIQFWYKHTNMSPHSLDNSPF